MLDEIEDFVTGRVSVFVEPYRNVLAATDTSFHPYRNRRKENQCLPAVGFDTPLESQSACLWDTYVRKVVIKERDVERDRAREVRG
jgi:hypothetical protein